MVAKSEFYEMRLKPNLFVFLGKYKHKLSTSYGFQKPEGLTEAEGTIGRKGLLAIARCNTRGS